MALTPQEVLKDGTNTALGWGPLCFLLTFGRFQTTTFTVFLTSWTAGVFPKHSMYGIFTYIGMVLGVNIYVNMPYMECLGLIHTEQWGFDRHPCSTCHQNSGGTILCGHRNQDRSSTDEGFCGGGSASPAQKFRMSGMFTTDRHDLRLLFGSGCLGIDFSARSG